MNGKYITTILKALAIFITSRLQIFKIVDYSVAIVKFKLPASQPATAEDLTPSPKRLALLLIVGFPNSI